MSRKNRNYDPSRARIVEAYGPSLRWTKIVPHVRLTPEVACEMRREGYSMVLVKTGWWKTHRLSLIRYLERFGSRVEDGLIT